MNVKINETKFSELFFDEQKSLVKLKWLSATKDIGENSTIIEIVEDFANAIKKYKPKFVIADDKEKFAPFDVEIQEKVGEIMAVLKENKAKKFAVILPGDFVSELSSEQTAEEVAKANEEDLEIQNFYSEQDALDWINL